MQRAFWLFLGSHTCRVCRLLTTPGPYSSRADGRPFFPKLCIRRLPLQKDEQKKPWRMLSQFCLVWILVLFIFMVFFSCHAPNTFDTNKQTVVLHPHMLCHASRVDWVFMCSAEYVLYLHLPTSYLYFETWFQCSPIKCACVCFQNIFQSRFWRIIKRLMLKTSFWKAY